MDAPTSYNAEWSEAELEAYRNMNKNDIPRSQLNPKYPHMLNEFVYKSCQFVNWTTLERIQQVENEFQFFNDDLILATYPKSGTTLMQEILWLLYNNGNTVLAKQEKVYTRFPFIEENYTNIFPGESREIYPIDYLPKMPRPRLIKSHLPFRIIGPRLENTPGMKLVLVLRNPKDTAVSYYHFYRGTVDYGPYRGSWSDFFDMWMDGWIVCGDWLTIISEWWLAAQRLPTRIHIVLFEDLLKHPIREIQRTADFLGRPCDNHLAHIIADHVSFDKMSKNESTNYNGVGGFTPDFRFMRKGQVGDWKNWFTVSQNELFDSVYLPRLHEIGLKFDYE